MLTLICLSLVAAVHAKRRPHIHRHHPHPTHAPTASPYKSTQAPVVEYEATQAPVFEYEPGGGNTTFTPTTQPTVPPTSSPTRVQVAAGGACAANSQCAEPTTCTSFGVCVDADVCHAVCRARRAGVCLRVVPVNIAPGCRCRLIGHGNSCNDLE